MSHSKKTLTILGSLLLIFVIFGSGVLVGVRQRPAIESVNELTNKETGKIDQVDFALFWKVWTIVKDKYVAPEELKNEDLVWGAIQGMVNAVGDPYTVFMPPKEHELFESAVRGDFEGVGMEIGMKHGILTVIAPIKGTPAYRAGIKAGDQILKINDTITANVSLEEAVRLIRGEKGTEIRLTIFRNNFDEPKEFKVVRERIEIPVIETEKGGAEVGNAQGAEQKKNSHFLGNDIFLIRLLSFSEKSPQAFRNAIREMVLSGRKKLILDLRNNPGGYLEASVDIASWFLPAGEIVVREDLGHGEERVHRSRGYDALDNIPVVILVNEGSASASEILAGALRDHGIAKLIGTKTFGKGSVQEYLPITENTSLKVTIARWLTPNRTSISHAGLEPDITVEPGENDKKDVQLEKALEVLNNWKK